MNDSDLTPDRIEALIDRYARASRHPDPDRLRAVLRAYFTDGQHPQPPLVSWSTSAPGYRCDRARCAL